MWTSVLLGCISDIENGYCVRAATAWLDPDNPFFTCVADALEWDPAYLRRKILETIKSKPAYRIRGIRMIHRKHLSHLSELPA